MFRHRKCRFPACGSNANPQIYLRTSNSDQQKLVEQLRDLGAEIGTQMTEVCTLHFTPESLKQVGNRSVLGPNPQFTGQSQVFSANIFSLEDFKNVYRKNGFADYIKSSATPHILIRPSVVILHPTISIDDYKGAHFKKSMVLVQDQQHALKISKFQDGKLVDCAVLKTWLELKNKVFSEFVCNMESSKDMLHRFARELQPLVYRSNELTEADDEEEAEAVDNTFEDNQMKIQLLIDQMRNFSVPEKRRRYSDATKSLGVLQHSLGNSAY
jgi:hypothetical protein